MESSSDRILQAVALRQAQRRSFNDRLAALDPSDSDLEPTPFRCECGLIACDATVRLTASEHAHVRRNDLHFVVLASHVIPEAESVRVTHRGWAIVEKPPGPAGDIAVRTAQRSRAPTVDASH